MRTIPLCGLSALLLACSADPTALPPETPKGDESPDEKLCLDDNLRSFIEARLRHMALGAGKAVVDAGGIRASWALTVAGADFGNIGHVHLVEPCTEPVEFDPYCDEVSDPNGGDFVTIPNHTDSAVNGTLDGLAPNVTHCLRFACEGEGIVLSHVWFAEASHLEEDDRHPILYATMSPPGFALHAPNSHMTWRTVIGEDEVDMTSSFSFELVIAPDEGVPFDATHEGEVRARKVPGEEHAEISVELEIRFPRLLRSAVVRARMNVDTEAQATGQVLIGEDVAAVIDGTLDEEEARRALRW